MSLFQSWGYEVTPRLDKTEFSRAPDAATGDRGEVSFYAFTISRGTGDAQTSVDVGVTRDEVLGDVRQAHTSPAYEREPSVLLIHARAIARRKAIAKFAEHDRAAQDQSA